MRVVSGYRAHSLRTTGMASAGPRPSAPKAPDDRGLAGGFRPTTENREPAPGAPPEGMVWIPGGEFSMGANDPPDMDDVGMKATLDGRPIHRVYVDGFFMDKTDVTNAQFAEFVKATGYVTVAERIPRPEDFPWAQPENLSAGGVVFSPPNHAVPLNNHLQWWSYVKGANWRHPSGPKSDIRGKGDYPVVQVANTHQGHFPNTDTGEDGFIGTSPVAHYPANPYDLYDMAGNVWQWTGDWYRTTHSWRQPGLLPEIRRDPKRRLNPSEPTEPKKVHRGGSYLCTDQYCSRYIVGTRGKGEISTGTNHLGFRCVMTRKERALKQ
jgi:formylglycine-generating enzyme